MFQILLTAWIWHRLTSVCLRLSRKLSRAFIPDEMKFKLLQQNGFENSLQSYEVYGTGFEKPVHGWWSYIEQTATVVAHAPAQ